MNSIYGLKKEELGPLLSELGQPAFRAKQIFEWVYQKRVTSWDGMVNMPKALREQLAAKLPFKALTLVRDQLSDDKETVKFLWKLADERLVESVLIYSGDRRTVCVSSQVGCEARCAFCASGKQGWKRDLSTGEIVEQIVTIDNWLRDKGERVTHVVYMGMGEPLLNYDAVVASIRILTDTDLMGLGQRKITVSTVGIIDGIDRLVHEDLKVNLVLSLHAPNQNVRKKIIPTARKYPLEEILASMDRYAEKTKRDITYEYILINGLNDAVEHAEELARLVVGRQCTVNLIPYNPVPGLLLERPSGNRVARFRQTLQRANVRNTCRYTKGDDIAAACGQLALQETSDDDQRSPTSGDTAVSDVGGTERASAAPVLGNLFSLYQGV